MSTLEPLGPGPELAMAYSNLAQLRMLADDNAAALHWGTKAIGLARELGDRETEMHALNNVGTALATAGDLIEGQARLTQSLDLALASDAHEHAARAFTNLGSVNVINWSLGDADRHLHAGITYCADRDLDTWRLYMTAWLARSLAEQGRVRRGGTARRRRPAASARSRRSPWSASCPWPACSPPDAVATEPGRWTRPSRSPSGRARPCGWSRWPRRAPKRRGSLGRTPDLVAAIDRAWPAAVAHPHPWGLGELSWWLRLGGDGRPAGAPLARPFALMLAGEHRAAAAAWEALGCPLWSAYALAFSPEIRDAQQCLDILDKLGAPAVRQAVLRDRHARGLAVPRGPAPASRANPAGLTAREAEVLQLLADGLSYAEVAERLVLSEKTVGHHVSAVLRKLGEPTRSRAVAAALRLGVIGRTPR